MGLIILPNQWTGQPQYPAPLNLNGFCRNVGFVYLPNIGYVDLASNVTFSVTTELTSRAGNNQIGGYPTSGTGYANTGATNFGRGYTLFSVCSASGTAYEAIMDDDAGGTRGFQFRFTNTGAINFIPFTDADGFTSVQSNNYTAAELAAGVPVIARVDAAGNIAVFGKGGKFTDSLGAAPRIPGNVSGNLGVRFFRWKGGGNQLTRPLYMAGALYRVISDAEAWSFIENPWQIFEPDEIPVAFGAATSGTIITCAAGNAVAAGQQASVISAITVSANTGNAVAAGLQTNVATNVTITANAGNAVAAGSQAGIIGSATITTSIGNAVAAGLTAAIEAGGATTITCSFGNAVAAGQAAQIASNVLIGASIGNAVAAGIAANVQTASTIAANVGNAVAIGLPATVTGISSIVINCATGNVLANGYQANVVETSLVKTLGVARFHKQEFAKRSNIQTSGRNGN